jgi:hypothetical protein
VKQKNIIFLDHIFRKKLIREGVNSSSKSKFVQHIADKIRCKPDTGKISVVVGARSRPFLR